MTGAFRGLPCTMEKRSAVKGKKMNQNLQNAITLFKQEPFAGTTGKWSNALISLQSRFRPLSRSSGGVALRKGIPESQSGPFPGLRVSALGQMHAAGNAKDLRSNEAGFLGGEKDV